MNVPRFGRSKQTSNGAFVDHEGRYYAEVPTPGVNPKDLAVTLQGGAVVVRGQRGEGASGVTRTIPLPEDAVPGNLQARYEWGLVVLTVPKNVLTESRKIQVDVV